MRHWTEDSLMNAVLGEITTAREAELRAHVAECAACREAFAHAKVARAAVDEGMKELVSGEPSANFESRLRARLAAEPAPGRIHQFWPAWAPATAAAFVVVALFLFVQISHLPRRANPPQEAHVADKKAKPPLARAINPASPSQRTAPLHSPVQHTARATLARPAGPEVLVEPGQLEAALQFADEVRSGHVDGEKLLAAEESANAPLEIKPLEVVSLMPPQFDLPADSAEGPSRR